MSGKKLATCLLIGALLLVPGAAILTAGTDSIVAEAADEVASEGWIQSGDLWWYQNADGSYPVSEWKLIDGKWYYFDASGWMTTGWQLVNSQWYFMDASGAMTTGWQEVGGIWYFLYEDGSMASNTVVDGYTLDASGAWVQDANQGQTGGSSISEGWVQSGGLWWYQNADGSYPASEWKLIDGKWYYFDESGWMVTGWRQVGGTWYFLYEDGSMASNTVVDGYTLDASGAWVQNAIPDPNTPSVSEGEVTQGSTSSGSQSSAEEPYYVVNTNSSVFHRPSCRHAKNASGSHWITLSGTRQEMLDQGYRPCEVCDP